MALVDNRYNTGPCVHVHSITEPATVPVVAEDSAGSRRPAAPNPGQPGIRVRISTRRDRDAVVVSVEGAIDMYTMPHLRAEIDTCFAGGLPGPHDEPSTRAVTPRASVCSIVVVDLTGVTFLASAGLELLVAANTAAHEHEQVVRVIIGDNWSVLRPVQIAGLDGLLAMFATVEDALDAGPAGATPGGDDEAAQRPT